MSSISEITRKILKYNIPFNKNEKEKEKEILNILNKKVSCSKIEDILFMKKPIRKKKEGAELKIFQQNASFKNIIDMNFIEDIVLVEKIITYKRYEIDNKIAILMILVNEYENVLCNMCLTSYKIANFDILKRDELFNNNEMNIGILKATLQKQVAIKDELFNYIRGYLSDHSNNGNLLSNLIEKYLFLNTELNKFKNICSKKV